MKAFTLLVACVLALPAFASEDAVAMIERLGGTFEVENAKIVKVDLHGSAVTDADLKLLATLTELRHLDLRLTQSLR